METKQKTQEGEEITVKNTGGFVVIHHLNVKKAEENEGEFTLTKDEAKELIGAIKLVIT